MSHPESVKLHKGQWQQADSREQQAQPKADPPLAEAGSKQRASRKAQEKRTEKGCTLYA